MSRDVPVIVPCFNNPTYVGGMLAQLQAFNINNIILIDNASNYAPMLELLQRVEKDVRVIRLRRNHGPQYFWKNRWFFFRLPRVFCVTDPDLRFNAAMPADFIERLLAATEQFAIGKAGLALDISDPSRMRPDVISFYGKTYSIWEWESQFWKQQISQTPDGDPIYKATIDTTFAVYNKKFFERKTYMSAVRFGGRYTAQHLPWYLDNGMPKVEEQSYRAAAGSHSWYFGKTIKT